jgi:CDP-paratose 2-epimerase
LPLAIVTGSGGLVGSESVAYLVETGFDVVGVENDMRAYFFGPTASTRPQTQRLLETYPDNFRSLELEIRDFDAIDRAFADHAPELELVIHRPRNHRTTGPHRSRGPTSRSMRTGR